MPRRLNHTYPSTRLREVYWRVRDVKGLPAEFTRSPISHPADLLPLLNLFFAGQVKERFLVIVLNAHNEPQAVEVISEGTMSASLVHPREVFRAAVVHLAASLIVAHNHPSGNPEPSREDIEITATLVNAGKVLGITVFDHVIYGDGVLTSLAERGVL